MPDVHQVMLLMISAAAGHVRFRKTPVAKWHEWLLRTSGTVVDSGFRNLPQLSERLYFGDSNPLMQVLCDDVLQQRLSTP